VLLATPHPAKSAFDGDGLSAKVENQQQQLDNHEARISNTEKDVTTLQANTNTTPAASKVEVPVVKPVAVTAPAAAAEPVATPPAAAFVAVPSPPLNYTVVPACGDNPQAYAYKYQDAHIETDVSWRPAFEGKIDGGTAHGCTTTSIPVGGRR
jgi:hypothetical protein